MISKSSIKKYLARELDSFTWLKKEPLEALNQALAELRPVPDFKGARLWNHQKACFLLLVTLKRFMLHIDMGGGKTLLTLLLIRYLKQCGLKPRAIVFVPYITSVETWIEEVAKHVPDLQIVPLLGTTKENLERCRDQNVVGDLYVIAYQSAVAMVSNKTHSSKVRSTWNFKASDIRTTFEQFNVLVMDEIHKCKSASSLTYRMCRAISSQVGWALGLTGTPFGKEPEDLWPQYYLVDRGAALGPTKEFFMAVFYKRSTGYWGNMEFTFRKKLMPELTRMIKHSSIVYGINEFADMPPRKRIPIRIPLPADVEGYVKKAIKDLNAGRKAGSWQIVESNYLQLRQLSSGFMTLKGADSAKLQVKFDEAPKMDKLQELIEAMPHGCKMVCFHHFIYTNKLISERLKEMKVGHARIWSGQKDPIGELRRFKADPKCTVLVINSKSGSSSLNLQGANYIVFFEQPDSPIDRQQAERRVWRPGQHKRVFIYDLLMRGTYDKKIMKSNESAKKLLDELFGRSN